MEKLTTNQKIGKNVRTFRLSKGLTQVQLADELSIHPKRLSNIEKGIKPISILILDKLCEYSELPHTYFLDFNEYILNDDDTTLINNAIHMLKSSDPQTRKNLCKTISIFTKK